MKNNKNARIALYAMAGVYLLIVAYQMFGNLDESMAQNERMLSIIFIVIFGIVGAGAVIAGILTGNKSMKQFKSEYYAEPEDDREIEVEKDKSTNEVEDELKTDENRAE